MCSIDNIEHARVCLSCEPCDVIRCSFIESLAIWVSCERWGVIRYIIATGETDQKATTKTNKQTAVVVVVVVVLVVLVVLEGLKVSNIFSE